MTRRHGGWKVLVLLLLVALLLGCDDPREPTLDPSAHGTRGPTLLLPGIDPRLPNYEAADIPALGTLYLATEADTRRLARHWAATFNAGQESLRVEVVTSGSALDEPWWDRRRAPTVALLQLPLNAATHRAFQGEWGHPAARLKVAMDPVVVVAQKQHPVVGRGLSLRELAGLFGDQDAFTHWSMLGLGGAWEGRPVTAYGQEGGSAVDEAFRARVLGHAPYRTGLVRHPNSRAVVAAVARDAGGIGYSAISALTGTVAVVPIRREERRHEVPTADEVADGDYPLPAGFVYLYVNRPPAITLDAPQRELVRFLYSREGQQVASNLGLLPISALQAAAELRRLNIRLAPENTVLASSAGRGR